MAPLCESTAAALELGETYSATVHSHSHSHLHQKQPPHQQQEQEQEQEQQQQQQQQQPQHLSVTKGSRRKVVSFSDYSEMYFIPHMRDMTDEEYTATYMSEKDYRRIHKESEETLREMKRGTYPGTTRRYFRGLELSLPQARMERKQRIEFAVAVVMHAQQNHQLLHPMWVHTVYSQLTMPAARAALAMGIWDAQAARAEDGFGEFGVTRLVSPPHSPTSKRKTTTMAPAMSYQPSSAEETKEEWI